MAINEVRNEVLFFAQCQERLKIGFSNVQGRKFYSNHQIKLVSVHNAIYFYAIPELVLMKFSYSSFTQNSIEK